LHHVLELPSNTFGFRFTACAIGSFVGLASLSLLCSVSFASVCLEIFRPLISWNVLSSQSSDLVGDAGRVLGWSTKTQSTFASNSLSAAVFDRACPSCVVEWLSSRVCVRHRYAWRVVPSLVWRHDDLERALK
jgi:hypothetical protein